MSAMQNRWGGIVASCALACVSAATNAGEAGRDPVSSLAASISRAAIPLQSSVDALKAGNFAPLKDLIGDARVVGLGEGEHAVHELLRVRNRLFEYLVEHLGFTAIAVESGFTESTAVDDFVLGKDVPSTRTLAASVFTFWPYAMQENRQLIEWMRAFNARPTTRTPIRFYGLDMLGRAEHPEGLAGSAHACQPFDAALRYLKSFAPEEAGAFRERLEPALATIYSAHYHALSGHEKEQLTVTIADLVSLFERRHVEWVGRSGALAYHRAYRNALNARGIDADLRAGGYWAPPPMAAASGKADVVGATASSVRSDIAQRDAELASHLQWVLQREGRRGRVLVFAHNTHLTKGPYYRSETGIAPFSVDASISAQQPVMGMHLRETLGSDFVSIATFFGTDLTELEAAPFSTADAETLDGSTGILARAGQDIFAVDLRALAASPESRAQLDRPWRVQFHPGMNPSNPRARWAINPLQSFDAMIFVQAVAKAQPWAAGEQ